MSTIFRKETIKYIVIALLVVTLIFSGVYVTSCGNISIEGATVDEATPDEVVTTTETISSSVVETTVESTSEVPTEEATTVENSSQVDYSENVTYTENEVSYSGTIDYELDLLARCIYQEAGICSEYCQWLVGCTVMNLGDYTGSGIDIVFDYNTFNVAYVLYSCTPSDTSYAVAERILSGDRDYNVMAFRTDYYHTFGTPYTSVDNVYFSTF